MRHTKQFFLKENILGRGYRFSFSIGNFSDTKNQNWTIFPLSFMTMKKIIFLDISSNREPDSQKPANKQTTLKNLQRTRQLKNLKGKFLKQTVWRPTLAHWGARHQSVVGWNDAFSIMHTGAVSSMSIKGGGAVDALDKEWKGALGGLALYQRKRKVLLEQ